MDLNRVILIGRMASDPELKYTPSGIPVSQFRLAVNRPISAEARQSGQEKQADFFSIVAWRQSAEYAANYLGKGRLVAIEGRLQVREYVTQDGQKRRDTEIVVDNLKSLDRPKEGGGGRRQLQRQRGRRRLQSRRPAGRVPRRACARPRTGPRPRRRARPRTRPRPGPEPSSGQPRPVRRRAATRPPPPKTTWTTPSRTANLPPKSAPRRTLHGGGASSVPVCARSPFSRPTLNFTANCCDKFNRLAWFLLSIIA